MLVAGDIPKKGVVGKGAQGGLPGDPPGGRSVGGVAGRGVSGGGAERAKLAGLTKQAQHTTKVQSRLLDRGRLALSKKAKPASGTLNASGDR